MDNFICINRKKLALILFILILALFITCLLIYRHDINKSVNSLDTSHLQFNERIKLSEMRYTTNSSIMVSLALIAGGIFVGLINFISKEISQNSFNPSSWRTPQLILFVSIILILLVLLTMAVWRWGIMQHEIKAIIEAHKLI